MLKRNKKAIISCLKVLSWHVIVGTEKSHEIPQSEK